MAIRAFVTAIVGEVFGECVERIRIQVGGECWESFRCVLSFKLDCDGAQVGLSSGCVDGDGARYWKAFVTA